MAGKEKEIRSSRWATIVYPESAPDNFVQLLKDFKVPFLISPLHNRDIDKDGKPKKEHYHVMLYFDSLKSSKQVKEIFDSIKAVGCEKVQSATSYARYLCHLDEDDKLHYNTSDVYSYGLDYIECAKNGDAKYEGIAGIIDYCLDNSVQSFSQLLIQLRKDGSHLFKVVCDNAYLVKSLISSLRQDAIDAEKRFEISDYPRGVNPDTGEIL